MPELKLYHGYELWHYVPSIVAAAVMAGCFAILTVVVACRTLWTRTWFSIPFIIGGVLEMIGYLDRIWAAYNTDQLTPYAIQAVLLLIAPALFAASIYMVLGRIITSVDAAHLSIIRPRRLTILFVTTDVLSFLIQSGGSSLQTNQDIDPDIPKAIVLVGLAVQIIAFGVFILTAVIFHRRLRRESTAASRIPGSRWRGMLHMLYAVNSLILIRSVFRFVEYAMGVDGYLFTHEWSLYVFDAELMLLSMALYAWWYPSGLQSRLAKTIGLGEEEMAAGMVPLDTRPPPPFVPR